MEDDTYCYANAGCACSIRALSLRVSSNLCSWYSTKHCPEQAARCFVFPSGLCSVTRMKKAPRLISALHFSLVHFLLLPRLNLSGDAVKYGLAWCISPRSTECCVFIRILLELFVFRKSCESPKAVSVATEQSWAKYGNGAHNTTHQSDHNSRHRRVERWRYDFHRIPSFMFSPRTTNKKLYHEIFFCQKENRPKERFSM